MLPANACFIIFAGCEMAPDRASVRFLILHTASISAMRALRAHLVAMLADGRPPQTALLPALTLATDFGTWEIMVVEGGLSAEAAAEIFVGWIRSLSA